MTTKQRLEHDLSAWFADTAGRETPEFAADILLATSGIRQRPSWTFVPFLRPMDRPLRPTTSGVAPVRHVVILVVVAGLLVLAAGAVWVASQPRLPAPFGPAANGLVAYQKDGDIFLVDLATGERSGLVLGPEVDQHPRWSLDGTLLAFVRGEGPGERLVVVDAAGTVQSVSGGQPLLEVDPDGIRWSPDGRTIAVRTEFEGKGTIYLVDARTGQPTVLPIMPWGLEAYWRPPDGRQLLFVGGLLQQPALYLYSMEDGEIAAVPGTVDEPSGGFNVIRPIGWTADGSRFAYHRSAPTSLGVETAVVDVETGDETVLGLGYGRISNDGSRIVGLASDGDRDWLCVAPVDGGACQPIEGSIEFVELTGWESFGWTPDDSAIWSRPDEGPAVLLDPDGGEVEWPSWAADGADSWQRRAP